MDHYERKKLRLNNYDYSKNGVYYITICTQGREDILSNIENGKIYLSNFGKTVEKCLSDINRLYVNVQLDKYVIMPDHVHFILIINEYDVIQNASITVSEIVKRFKTFTTKIYIEGVKKGIYPPFEKKLWQKSFNDHIIREQDDYEAIWNYIENNPINWEKTM